MLLTGLNLFRDGNSFRTSTNDFRQILKNLTIVILVLAALSAAADTEPSNKVAPIRVEGSFVIAAICKDGIIVASDSRGTLKDKQGRRIAYYDVNQKIFPVGRELIADTGYASLNDPKLSFLSALMSRFARDPLSRVDVDRLPASYFNYIQTELPPAGATSARLQTLVFAGYSKGSPELCIYDGELDRSTKCRYSGYVSSPHQGIRGLENVSSLSFQQAADVMRNTIEDYAAAVQPGSVGGPVIIRTITSADSQWFNAPLDWPTWETFTDLANDYKAQRISFHLMPGITESQLDALIDDGVAWAHFEQTSNSES